MAGKVDMTRGAAAALLEQGPRALAALDLALAGLDPGRTEICGCCGLRKVENFRDDQLQAQLRAMRDRLSKFVEEARSVR